jgi:CRISPR/Cas system-associated exonuclease Cas4 (RecB family)
MRTIRASEINTYLYCKRAWWYELQGVDSQNLSELASGSELHYSHGRAVIASGLIRTLAYVLLLLALILLAIYLTKQIL